MRVSLALTSVSVFLALLCYVLWLPAHAPVAISVRGTPKVHVDINEAPFELLLLLPGVGEKTAGKIVALRRKRPIRSAKDLAAACGFGPSRLARLLEYVVF